MFAGSVRRLLTVTATPSILVLFRPFLRRPLYSFEMYSGEQDEGERHPVTAGVSAMRGALAVSDALTTICMLVSVSTNCWCLMAN
jgi:hypothetical protein